jgi:hypothetical protein
MLCTAQASSARVGWYMEDGLGLVNRIENHPAAALGVKALTKGSRAGQSTPMISSRLIARRQLLLCRF